MKCDHQNTVILVPSYSTWLYYVCFDIIQLQQVNILSSKFEELELCPKQQKVQTTSLINLF
ncbi:hypothetical protein RhiirC2_797751 [Rhizophagus irregularis]|uniref:Uncharacterized protein n=1 Tax=Rhizophagus irregularis TaxID=588596 RepID=A0A2N1M7H9_9GLOM|nr:hypothetical protein RhiirC2_797751 [Rhizophagus irregularis]